MSWIKKNEKSSSGWRFLYLVPNKTKQKKNTTERKVKQIKEEEVVGGGWLEMNYKK
jgi:hypothetical protein